MPSDFTPRFCIKDHFFGEISLLKLSFLLLRKNELFWRSEILIQNQDKKSRSIIRDGGDSKLVGKNQRSVTIFNWIYMHMIQISVSVTKYTLRYVNCIKIILMSIIVAFIEMWYGIFLFLSLMTFSAVKFLFWYDGTSEIELFRRNRIIWNINTIMISVVVWGF